MGNGQWGPGVWILHSHQRPVCWRFGPQGGAIGTGGPFNRRSLSRGVCAIGADLKGDCGTPTLPLSLLLPGYSIVFAPHTPGMMCCLGMGSNYYGLKSPNQ